MYKKEEGTGRIRLTMSKDSTCHLLAEDRFTPDQINSTKDSGLTRLTPLNHDQHCLGQQ